jgi:hypothetical protein
MNNKISLQSLYIKLQKHNTFINWQKTKKLYLFLNLITQLWRDCQISSEQTSNSSAFLNSTCLLKNVYSTVNSIFHFPSRWIVIGLTKVYYTELSTRWLSVVNLARSCVPNTRDNATTASLTFWLLPNKLKSVILRYKWTYLQKLRGRCPPL